MKKIYILLILNLLSFISLSQDTIPVNLSDLNKDIKQIKKLKINGWAQVQYQKADTLGLVNLDGGDFPLTTDNRFMIRRGRIKFSYDNSHSQYVIQLNLTERFINIADLYVKYNSSLFKGFSLQTGMMNRPFGYDISYSSSDRESPERARYTQLLMPNERDLGAEFIFEPKKINGLKFTTGLFNGTGLMIPNINLSDIDSKKDLISRLSYYNKHSNINYGLGVSNYYGFERLANNRLYELDNSNFFSYKCKDTTTTLYKNLFVKRLYYNIEGLLSYETKYSKITLRGEYIFGQQPGINFKNYMGNRSPQNVTSGDTYLRTFNGGYFFIINKLNMLPIELVLKYEWFDPNSLVSGKQLLKSNNFSGSDIKYEAIGYGLNIMLSENIKLMCYYNNVKNEIAGNIQDYNRNLKDDIYTIRLQMKF